MAKDLLHILTASGLDEREAQLYLAGLRLGSAPASDYASATGINRITAYNALEQLARRGLFTLEKKMNAKCYAPVPPEYVAVEARKNADAVQRSLPEMRSLMGAHYRQPHVRFFDGWDGVRRVYEDTLTAKSELLNFADSAVIRRFWPTYDDEYVAERVRRGIRLRGIAPDDAAGRKVHGEDRRSLREIRLVPAKDFDFSANEINIYDHTVAICCFEGGATTGDMFGVLIESTHVAEAQRQIFEMAWRYAGSRRGK